MVRAGAFLVLAAMLALVSPVQAQTAAAAAQQAAAPTGPFYVLTYFEIAPPAASEAVGLLRQFADATKREAGNVEFTALHEIGRPGRFALVEAWRDKAAHDAHKAAMTALGEKLRTSFVAPFDARPFWGLSVAQSDGGEGGLAAVYVLTHVDVSPAGKDEVATMVKQLAETSRKESGELRFDALVWDGRPNHMHLIEEWSGRGAREAHILAEPTRQFRAKLVPFEGALYDERLYEPVR